MSKTSVARKVTLAKVAAPTEPSAAIAERRGAFSGSGILSYEWLVTDDVKELARGARAVSTLALLAFAGMMQAIATDSGLSGDNQEEALLGDLLDLASQACFCLEQKLGAVKVA